MPLQAITNRKSTVEPLPCQEAPNMLLMQDPWALLHGGTPTAGSRSWAQDPVGTHRLLGSLHGLNSEQPLGWQLSTASGAVPVPWERRGSEDRRWSFLLHLEAGHCYGKNFYMRWLVQRSSRNIQQRIVKRLILKTKWWMCNGKLQLESSPQPVQRINTEFLWNITSKVFSARNEHNINPLHANQAHGSRYLWKQQMRIPEIKMFTFIGARIYICMDEINEIY